MKQASALMNFRPGVKVIDATLRDGGLCNDFYFTDEFVQQLYLANLRAGVDYMEFGYRASKELFDVNKYGKWKFCNDEDIRKIVGDNATDMKIAVMADVGRCDYRTDIGPKSESPIDMYRVATYINTIPTAVDMIQNLHDKGYETSCNIMAISKANTEDIKLALELICQSPVDVIYIVDSYGSLYPEQIARIVSLYKEYADKYGKKLGIHAHNNQQLAFANTIEAVGDGVDYLDATYDGMGRGAGNCSMELLLGLLRNPKYSLYPVYKFIDEHITPLKEQGVHWGYSLQYQMTGLLNQHPRAAIQFTNQNRTDFLNFYKEIVIED